MLLLAIGIGALGALAFRRAHRRYHGHGRCGGHGRYWRHHHGPWGGHRARRRWMIDLALERIDASPAQERAIIAELEQLEDRLHTAGRGLRDLRGPLADAFRASELDEGALAGIVHDAEQAHNAGRDAVVDTLRKIHGLLDDRQREQLASLLGRGARRGAPGGAPYRT
ncbi:MAG TPA: hypothetical protein VHE35_19370 [Kofleriaceae bacterium]|nr:hypothetical protein [Kofleriaceae bacterium]